MKFFRKYFHKKLIRPIITKTVTKALIALAAVLVWDRFANVETVGISRLSIGLSAVGLILVLMSWFSYLHLDGLTPIDQIKSRLLKPGRRKTKPARSRGGDIADYLDEEIIPYEDLEDDEKAVCRLVSYVLSGLILIVISFFVPLG